MKNQFENDLQSKPSLTEQFASIHKGLNIGLLVIIAGLYVFSGSADAAIVAKSNPVVLLDNKYKATGSVPDSIGVTHFVAIPYGMPTTGSRRWRPPQAWEPNTVTPSDPGDPGAVRFDPAGLGSGRVPQCMPGEGAVEGSSALLALPFSVPGAFAPLKIVSSENCLYLNVYTKYANKDSKKPVFVYIHGGGNRYGTAMTNLYNPTPKGGPSAVPSFLETVDGVVVTFNYRVGPFGFLAHPSLTAEAEGTSGTYGNLDQILALKWVQSNIAKFGGAANNVTVFGESAGALNTSILSASPLANGLFQRTIQQSGYSLPLMFAGNLAGVLSDKSSAANNAVLKINAFDPEGFPKWPSLKELEKIGTGLAAVLANECPTGVKSGQEGDRFRPWGACGYKYVMSIEKLRDLSPGIIGAAYSNSSMQTGSTPVGLGIFVPVPPIDDKLLTKSPMSVLKRPGAVIVKPAIIGTTRDEYTSLLKIYASSVEACAVRNAVNDCSENAAGVNLLSADGSGFKKILQGIFGESHGASAFETLPDQYKPNRFGLVRYTNARDFRDAVVSLLTDAVFTCHSRSVIRYTAQSSKEFGPSYRYQLTHQPSAKASPTLVGNIFAALTGYDNGESPSVSQLGAMHGLDIGYVFGPLSWSQFFNANSAPEVLVDTKLAKIFQTSWGEFGRTGSVPSVWPFAAQFRVWTPYPNTDSVNANNDPVFKFDIPITISNGTLSSESGYQFGFDKKYESACDWIDRYMAIPL
ncbi:MAG: carboxylesterase type B [Burkholderiaceae bacterium]|jgi:carboxylesterase type B